LDFTVCLEILFRYFLLGDIYVCFDVREYVAQARMLKLHLASPYSG